ncbi:MAG: metallophosphoesterase family protein [Planctomycetes bacterium]|nr:metallophosphoesterase family protein [Planctomycetota bacterium]
MIAILSDLHGNLEALEAVLADIRSRGIEEIYCLGDLIDYGPDPEACVDRALQFKVTLMGNHEEAVMNIPLGFNPVAKRSLTWTRSLLKPGLFSSQNGRRRWSFIRQLPRSYEMDDILLVHGSPRDPTNEYIMKGDTEDLLGEIPEKIREILELVRRFCFVGHSHLPGLITDEGIFYTPAEIEEFFPVAGSRKLVVNVGSVGQPRDGDNRACYVTLDDNVVRFHRVAYDFNATIEKVKGIEALDKFNGERLAAGR